MNTEKPRAKPGSFCPLWRKDVSRVCHTCEMWEILKVFRVGNKEPSDQWGCTLKHQTFILRDLGTALDGLQRAQESARNTAWDETQKNLKDVLALAQHQSAFNGDVLRRVADGFSELARAVDARVGTAQIATRVNDQPLLEQQQ